MQLSDIQANEDSSILYSQSCNRSIHGMNLSLSSVGLPQGPSHTSSAVIVMANTTCFSPQLTRNVPTPMASLRPASHSTSGKCTSAVPYSKSLNHKDAHEQPQYRSPHMLMGKLVLSIGPTLPSTSSSFHSGPQLFEHGPTSTPHEAQRLVSLN